MADFQSNPRAHTEVRNQSEETMKILLLEGETRIADFLHRGLEAEGWTVDHPSMERRA